MGEIGSCITGAAESDDAATDLLNDQLGFQGAGAHSKEFDAQAVRGYSILINFFEADVGAFLRALTPSGTGSGP